MPSEAPLFRFRSLWPWAVVLLSGVSPGQAYEPPIAPASEDARIQMEAFQLSPGFDVRLFSAEPWVANPVCFHIDSRGRVFVAETFRQEENGVPDNRAHGVWLADDLKAQTLEDRRAMYLTHRPHYARQFTQHHDRIVRLADRDGDGRADEHLVFADGFNDILDGTGAGVLTQGSRTWYACIPNLWELVDADDDGKAERRRVVHHGFGVRVALRGHDLHGLVFGPDGRLYFSIGDRGYDVHTPEGQHLHRPYTGAVFRCEPDGAGLEVFATGLRNPQELVFDDFGNLFTVDNNSDSEDRARVLYVVEGGETGWRMNFQTRPDRGGWVAEGWWKTRHPGQAAFLIPPLAHLGSGPSGLALYPGTGWAGGEGSFLFCDFLGGRSHSGVRSFRLEPDGAGFRVVDQGKWLWGCLATDVDFAPDGTVFVSDWVEGWTGAGKGRLYTLRTQDPEARRAGAATATLLGGDWSQQGVDRLAELLGHGDRRVRQAAQFELVERGNDGAQALWTVARSGTDVRARVCALFGLGQMMRRGREWDARPVLGLLTDPEVLVRGQAVRFLSELPNPAGADRIAALLDDESPRVRYAAALGLSRFRDPRWIAPLLKAAASNADQDPYLRHGVVMGLVGCGDPQGLVDQVLVRYSDASDPGQQGARRAAVLALRRLEDQRVSLFLLDPEEEIAAEAALAIYDVPIPTALPDLAAVLEAQPGPRPRPLLRRALAAVELLGDPSRLGRLAQWATDRSVDPASRRDAIDILADWADEREFDRVLNMWRPRVAGAQKTASERAEPWVQAWLEDSDAGVSLAAVRAARKLRLASASETLERRARDERLPSEQRVPCLDAVAHLAPGRLLDLSHALLESSDGKVRAGVMALVPNLAPDTALPLLDRALQVGGPQERQASYRSLAKMGTPEAADRLADGLSRLLDGQEPPETWLEVLEGARRLRSADRRLDADLARYGAKENEDALARWLPAAAGGEPERGKKIFLENSEVSCRRCHALDQWKPTDPNVLAGPDLSGVGSRLTGRDLLISIVDPNAALAVGFEDWLVELDSQRVQALPKGSYDLPDPDQDIFRGRIVEESDAHLVMEIKEFGQPTVRPRIPKSAIIHRSREKSAMPEDLRDKLSLRDLRDLVAFLGGCR